MEMLSLNGMALFIAAMFHPLQSNGCRMHIQREIIGYHCLPLENSPLKQFDNMRWHQCTLYCLQNINCTLVTYDAALMECILYADMCSNMMQANPDVRTIILSPTPLNCLEWRPVDTQWLENLVVVNEIGANGVNYTVGRLTDGSRTLPARYSPDGSFYTTDGTRPVTTQMGEFLIVHPLCPYQWMTWISTFGDDLPTGAVVGGHLENGMPLYVAKAWLNERGGVWVIGYYNPQTKAAHLYFGAQLFDTTTMDILVIL